MNWINPEMLKTAGVDLSTAKPISDTVMTYTIPGGIEAVNIWIALADQSKMVGGWPVLCGNADEFGRIVEMLKMSHESVETILAAVREVPPPEANEAERVKKRKATMDYLKKINPTLYETLKQNTEIETAKVENVDFSSWPSTPPDRKLRPNSAFHYSGAAHESCILAICLTHQPYEVPAFFRFGNFNDCPSSAIHVAYLRDWNRRYDAVPISVTADVIELYVSRPLLDRQEALSVAREQYAYCPDIVDQGTQTVGNLAREIWGASSWFFWWD